MTANDFEWGSVVAVSGWGRMDESKPWDDGGRQRGPQPQLPKQDHQERPRAPLHGMVGHHHHARDVYAPGDPNDTARVKAPALVSSIARNQQGIIARGGSPPSPSCQSKITRTRRARALLSLARPWHHHHGQTSMRPGIRRPRGLPCARQSRIGRAKSRCRPAWHSDRSDWQTPRYSAPATDFI